ncbi:hypothetical protein D3C76_324220 [compost metagenome]
MNYSYIILNEALAIKNARNEIVHQFRAGDRVKVDATTEFYWMTEHGAVWFSQAKLESHVLFGGL